jgi:peptidoglycan LD-endopeptidase LytH
MGAAGERQHALVPCGDDVAHDDLEALDERAGDVPELADGGAPCAGRLGGRIDMDGVRCEQVEPALPVTCLECGGVSLQGRTNLRFLGHRGYPNGLVRRFLVLAVALVLLLPARADAASVAAQLAAAQKRANRAAASLNRAESALATAEAELADVEVRAVDARDRLSRITAGVKQSAVRQYMEGGVGQPFVLGEDLNASVRANEMVRFVTVGAADDLDRYRAARDDLDAAESALTARRDARTNALAAARKQRTAAIAEVNRLARLQKTLEARLRAQRGSGSSSSARGVSFVVSTGAWACPVAGPHSFSNDWGAPRSGGRRHQGNDILSPRGTPVVASVSGSVRRRSGGLGGLAYYLAGDDGNTYYGAHLASFGPGVGRVSKGAVVGYVGTTGNASGGPPHLHFEIHPGGGRAVNPYPTLRQYC